MGLPHVVARSDHYPSKPISIRAASPVGGRSKRTELFIGLVWPVDGTVIADLVGPSALSGVGTNLAYSGGHCKFHPGSE